MRSLTMDRMQGLKAVLMMGALLGAPAWADDAAAVPSADESRGRGTLMVELQPPSLDASLYGLRIAFAPTADSPFAFALVRRAGDWNTSLGMRSRFSGTDAGDAKLNFAWGMEGRYALASFADGALRPFVGATVGVEEFRVRGREGANELDFFTGFFLEPELGVMYRPGAGRVGLTARVGPGFSSTEVPEHVFGAGTLRLRSVYPAASLGLLFVL
jgi:hypothetical protein